MDRAAPSMKRALCAASLCALAYLYVFPYTPSLNNPNENVRLYMTAAMVEEGTYEINTLRKRWGWVNDAAVKDGKIYSVKAPGTSFVGVPGYAVYSWIKGGEVSKEDMAGALWASRFAGTILPAILFMFFLYRWYGRQARAPVMRDAAFVSVALGSSVFGYTLLFASHTTSAICAFGAFMLLYDARREGTLSWGQSFAAGLMVAGVTFFEYPGFIISLILSLYALTAVRPWRRLALFALGGLIPTLLVMHFQGAAFGDPFSPGHLYVENPAFRAGHEEGFFGATHFHWDGAAALLFDLRLGLLSMTPLFFLAIPGFALLIKDRETRVDACFALAACVCLFTFICFMNIWHAGWSIGPRYLTALIPFVGWAAMRGGAPLVERWPRVGVGLVGALVIVGLVASGIPSAYYPHLPESMDRPLGQLFGVLIQHGFAPPTAGRWLLGMSGNASMIPLLLVGLGAVWLVLGTQEGRARWVSLGIAAALGAAILWPQWTPATKEEVKARGFVRHVTRNWNPSGGDRAAQLEASIAGGARDPELFLELAHTYHIEGREEAAQDALERGLKMLRGY